MQPIEGEGRGSKVELMQDFSICSLQRRLWGSGPWLTLSQVKRGTDGCIEAAHTDAGFFDRQDSSECGQQGVTERAWRYSV
jgi:hypothetical protein